MNRFAGGTGTVSCRLVGLTRLSARPELVKVQARVRGSIVVWPRDAPSWVSGWQGVQLRPVLGAQAHLGARSGLPWLRLLDA
jgi:hypothetical protein